MVKTSWIVGATLVRYIIETWILLFLVLPETGGWTTAVLFLLTAEIEFRHLRGV